MAASKSDEEIAGMAHEALASPLFWLERALAIVGNEGTASMVRQIRALQAEYKQTRPAPPAGVAYECAVVDLPPEVLDACSREAATHCDGLQSAYDACCMSAQAGLHYAQSPAGIAAAPPQAGQQETAQDGPEPLQTIAELMFNASKGVWMPSQDEVQAFIDIEGDLSAPAVSQAEQQTAGADDAWRRVREMAEVLRSVNEEFGRFGERFPDGFDHRLFRHVENAVAMSYDSPPSPREEQTMHAAVAPRAGIEAALRRLLAVIDHLPDGVEGHFDGEGDEAVSHARNVLAAPPQVEQQTPLDNDTCPACDWQGKLQDGTTCRHSQDSVVKTRGKDLEEFLREIAACGVAWKRLPAVERALNTYVLANNEKHADLLQQIDIKAEAGLCCFTLASAREFLKDIRKLIAEAKS